MTVSESGNISVLAKYDQNFVRFGSDTIYVYPFTGFNDVAIVAITQPVIIDTAPIFTHSQWFDIFPNPNSGEFNIGLHEDFPQGSYFEIWDVLGRRLDTFTPDGYSQVFRVENLLLGKGKYFILLKSSEGKILQSKSFVTGF